MADREYVMLEDKNGKEVLPVTDGNGVFVEGGTKKLDKKLTEINEQLDNKTNKTETQNIQQQVNNLVLGAVGDGNNPEIIQARGKFEVLNDRLNAMYEKEVVENIIKNSALNNTDNWSNYGCVMSAENNVLTVVGSEQYAQAMNSEISVNYGDKLYIRCGVNTGSNSNIKIEVVEQYTSESYLSIDCSSEAGFKYYSGIATITKEDIIYSMFRVINYENSSVPFQITKPLMVNLTEVFGKGNEPSVYEFEKMLSELYFEKTYIDNFELNELKENINNIGAVGDGNNAEIIQARGGYTVLNERLDSMYQKYIVKNIIKNSALNNTDNWSNYGCVMSAENNVLTVVGSEQYAQVRNNDISVNYGDKLYIRCGVNTGSNSNIKIEVVEQYTSESYLSLDCSSTAGLKFYSGVANITKSDINYCMFRVINYENSSIPFQVTKPLMVNLTKVFGKGNEPSVYEFEKMLSELYFEKTYIDDFRLNELKENINNTKKVITETIGDETQISWIDGNNNMMLVFKPCGVNNLPQIKDLYKNGIKMLDGNTDFISPFIVAGDSQFAGDKTESFEFTGGYHGYNGDGTGTPTARNILYKVINDNNKCKIVVVNNIQGFNTKKVDGTGKEILQEEITYTITPCKVNVDVKLTALEWCRISTYMGLQAQNTPWEERILICDDDTHKQWMSLAYQNINGGNKTQSSCNKLILNKDNNYLEMKIDNSYGLGKLKYVSDSSPLMWCADYNKTYFNLVKDKDLTLTKNDVICWSGEYKIYSV